MTSHTHPTPEKFAKAVSAIAVVDQGIASEVRQEGRWWLVEFENGKKARFRKGALQDTYNL